MQNTFGNESFLDECAAVAGVDPIEFRRRKLKDARGLELIDRLAKLAAWTPRGKPGGNVQGDVAYGRGVSYIKYELVRTYVGVVADVAVNRKTGKVRVTQFYVAHDCGQIINPDGLRNQIEGNVVQTVSRTLIEDLKFSRSAVTSVDWETLSDPDFPGRARGRDRPDRPPEREAVGRGRADGRGRALGDRQRDLRCDRCAAALGAVHAGEGTGRAEDDVDCRVTYSRDLRMCDRV